MKAVVYTEYGSADVLQFTEVAKPTPEDNEVLIRVRASSVNALDWRLMTGTPLFIRPMIGGVRKPRATTPGADVAGHVEATGSNVTQFKPGDEVFGGCLGAFAEHVCAAEDKLVLKPTEVSFETAAAMPVAAITALQGLRDHGCIQGGQRVLIDGASGGVGTFAVQIAKTFGAEVTAVCSTRNVETARSNGANHVVDYTQEDFTRSGRRYDLIFAANAYHSVFGYRRALERNGIYVMAGGGSVQLLQGMLLGPLLSKIGSKKMRFFMANIVEKDLALLSDLLVAGEIEPVVDRRYPLSDAAEAVRYLGQGHAKGKVVITMDG
ncbi:MAG: NAD(P)-dependent alcohol dehydrogenase [bacterium]|nr:NAD(P)-dependent alcohol dehydrogenase [bacterium]